MAHAFSGSQYFVINDLALSSPFTIAIKANYASTSGASAAIGVQNTTTTFPRRYMGRNLAKGLFYGDSSYNYNFETGNITAGVYVQQETISVNGNLVIGYVDTASAQSTQGLLVTETQLVIGARMNQDAPNVFGLLMNGSLAEAALWSVALTADEVNSLNKGFSPRRIRPQSRVRYIPLIRNVAELQKAAAISATGTTTAAAHPRVYP